VRTADLRFDTAEVLQSLFYFFSLGDLLRECNDLDAAEQHLAEGMALIKETLTVEPFVEYRSMLLPCWKPSVSRTSQISLSPLLTPVY